MKRLDPDLMALAELGLTQAHTHALLANAYASLGDGPLAHQHAAESDRLVQVADGCLQDAAAVLTERPAEAPDRPMTLSEKLAASGISGIVGTVPGP